MTKMQDFMVGTIIILLAVFIGFMIHISKQNSEIHKKIDKIYSIIDPDRVNTEIEVKSN